MIDHEKLVRAASVDDGAATLLRAAGEIDRFAGRFDAVSENTLRRVAAQLRTIATLRRAKPAPTPVAVPGDVMD